ncbi:hypothetical protein [Acetobacter conturbans]|uniref:hypothetical protein n=1 Tax=Acetobacter conturbans TaxID=1737472 RepID=UPI001F54FEBF|nr:hypothetical protein [Acetobacter conturbans]
MTLALALLPLLALFTILAGLAATPALGILTALSIVLLRHSASTPLPPVILFTAITALTVSVAPAWWLSRYTEDTAGRPRIASALALSLVMLVAASLSLPSEDLLQPPAILAVPFVPMDAAVVTVALAVTFIGLVTLSLRSGVRYQFAGLLTACNGLLLTAANIRTPYAGWLIGACVLLLAGAGTWLASRLSLLRMKAPVEAPVPGSARQGGTRQESLVPEGTAEGVVEPETTGPGSAEQGRETR